ncbi:Hypothetical predicted protein [Paramuricea clavata]|uniref:Uncharacterized protein n=1 Tax=Paramuricea clavata TaxID=317549 RepID=A0A6S7JC64_PARCT|nr:Hypothetical predicted protein [Paramuricea clavata]
MSRHLRGTNNTHVANATGRPIFARVDEDAQQIKSIKTEIEAEFGVKVGTGKVNVGVNSKLKTKTEIEYFEKKLRQTHGFTTIGPGQFDNFPSNNPHVSIFYKNGSGLGEVMSDTKKVSPDISVIATPTGLVTSQYGNVWLDASGKNWKR